MIVMGHQVGIIVSVIESSACGVSGVSGFIRSKGIISEIVHSETGRWMARLPDLRTILGFPRPESTITGNMS